MSLIDCARQVYLGQKQTGKTEEYKEDGRGTEKPAEKKEERRVNGPAKDI